MYETHSMSALEEDKSRFKIFRDVNNIALDRINSLPESKWQSLQDIITPLLYFMKVIYMSEVNTKTTILSVLSSSMASTIRM